MGRIGVFGGSFDPIHNGHVILGLRAWESASLDRVLLVPAAQSPHKGEAAPSLPGSFRAELCELAFDSLSAFSVDRRELTRGDVSYAVDTLSELADEYPEDALYFLLGADAVEGLHTWKDAARLVELATFLWMPRPGTDDAVAAAARERLPGLRLEVVDAPLIDISATMVRERRSNRRPLRGFLPERVAARLARLTRDGA